MGPNLGWRSGIVWGMRIRKPSPGTLIALLALFVALGGPAEAAKLISGAKIKRNSITSSRIRNHTLTSKDIAKKTVRSLKRTSSSVSSAQILDGTVSLSDMAFGSVTGNQVVDRSLSAVDLAANTITANELATGSVGNAELAADSVSNNKIATGAVSKGSIRPDAVGADELIGPSGTLNANTLDPIPVGTCKQQTFPVTGAAGTAVVVSGAPNGFIASGRAEGSGIVLQVCNLGADAAPANGAYAYVAVPTA